MVAFIRHVLVALPAAFHSNNNSSGTSLLNVNANAVDNNDNNNRTAPELESQPQPQQQDKALELQALAAVLSGQPVMDGPLILPPSSSPLEDTNYSITDPILPIPQQGYNLTTTTSNATVFSQGNESTIQLETAPEAVNQQQQQQHQQQQSSTHEPLFSLYDWTLAFRECARLATARNDNFDDTRSQSPLVLMLTPGLRKDPPSYTMSNYGGGEDSPEKAALLLQPLESTEDSGTGQLLFEGPPASNTVTSHLHPSSRDNSIAINATSETTPTVDTLLTTAAWLVRPSDSILSISTSLHKWLQELHTKAETQQWQNHNQTNESDWSMEEQVNMAISLSSRVNLSTTSPTTTTKSNEHNNYMTKSAKVRALAPNYFANLRQSFGIDENSYWKSILDESLPFVSFQSNSKGAERVGGLFFFTHDGAYMIKTIKPDEVTAFLGTILPKYGPYMKQYGQTSLLTRFCGLYQVRLSATTTDGNGTHVAPPQKSRVHTFAVMNSVFPAQASHVVSERFDLKGSTLGRQCSLQERQDKGSLAILKDLDLAQEVEFMRSTQQHHGRAFLQQKEGLHVGSSAKARLMSQLIRDVELLRDCNAIDYSLLVGVSVRKSPSLKFLKSILQHDSLDRHENTVGPLSRSTLTPLRLPFGLDSNWNNDKLMSSKDLVHSHRLVYDDTIEKCGVNGGPLSRLQGERLGRSSVYYLGVIDFLQPYNSKKRAEYRWKYLRHGGSQAGFSCVPPAAYAKRFLDFMDRHIT